MRLSRSALSVAALAGVATPVLAQTGQTPAKPLHVFQALALAPAGDRIVTIEGEEAPAPVGAGHGRLVVRAAQDGHILSTSDPCPRCRYSDPAFAADGRIAFIARDTGAGVARLMLLAGGEARTLAEVRGLAATPRWSPDGRSIALLVTPGARKEAGAVQAGVRAIGEIGVENDEQRIAVVPAGGGALRLVSPAGRYVYEYDWTPDGRGFVATSAEGNGDANWWVATLDGFDLATGARRPIAAPKVQMNAPRVSPDGRSVAFIGGLMSDFGSIGGDVYVVPLAGGTPRNVTPGFKGSVTGLTWDKAGLRGTALAGADSQVVRIDPAARGVTALYAAPARFQAADGQVALAGDRVAMVAQDWETPPYIAAGPISAPRRLTHDNDAWTPRVRARSLSWMSEGHRVQGWLIGPASPAPGKAPMVTVVHGGPAAATVPNYVWQGTNAALIAKGYWIFYPNPRGSYGQGEAFTAANKRDFGGGDLRDILAGVDAAIAAAPVDGERLGLMGGSYGGFMAMWANTQTNRFKGIVASAGLSDWISYYGTNGINSWMIPFFGASAYADHDAYWKVSPVREIARAKTPTLILVGERDIEVPPTQSVEYWNGLKAFGVDTRLVIYPDEGHHIAGADHVEDVRRRTLDWFDRTLGTAPTPRP
ncbi:S9 family peptidase [Sphingomonas morindae]|uniref:S9 family peptidase n=1 Tax=Sphingomonas morindae TaxID=1541170 RepID=A0ABY4X9J1_9SPHN|nr:S9 family peptidase [Sphingomonas morindae]USI73619.1 S9 family peptidase [Sphingomonas morindae]